MNITPHGLTRAAGASAATAGAIFVAVQINHPPADVAHIATAEMAVRESAKILFTVLALVGFAGMFLRNRQRLGVLGLAGYLLVSVGFLALFAVECVVACVLPALAHSNPGYVQDVLDAAVGSSRSGDIGGMQILFDVSGAGYMIGGLLFGIALFRSGLLARWASALLAAATVATSTLAFLPESFNRPMAVPMGVALVGLGVSLWRTQGAAEQESTVTVSTTAGVEPSPVR